MRPEIRALRAKVERPKVKKASNTEGEERGCSNAVLVLQLWRRQCLNGFFTRERYASIWLRTSSAVILVGRPV